jgi:hypothetical protein
MNGIKHKLCVTHHPGINESHHFTADEFRRHYDAKGPTP